MHLESMRNRYHRIVPAALVIAVTALASCKVAWADPLYSFQPQDRPPTDGSGPMGGGYGPMGGPGGYPGMQAGGMMPYGAPQGYAPAYPSDQEMAGSYSTTQYPGMQTQFQQPVPGGGYGPGPGAVAPYPVDSYGQSMPLPRRLNVRRWSVGFEVLALTEGSHPNGGPIILQSAAQNGMGPTTTRFTNNDLTGSYGFGPKVTLGVAATPRRSYEVVYFGIYDWKRSYAAVGDGTLTIPDPNTINTLGAVLTEYRGDDVMTMLYRIDINNVELNVLQAAFSENRRFVAGFRYLDWHEQFTLRATDQGTVTNNEMRFTTGNNLFGGQIGYNGTIVGSLGATTIKIRAGLFDNESSQHSVIRFQNNASIFRDTMARADGPASLGELAFSHTMTPSQHLQVNLGYNLIWIQGLARAPGQIDFTDVGGGTGINKTDSVFLHGASAGATLSW